MFDSEVSRQQVDASAAGVLMNLRNSLEQVMAFATWLQGQQASDLTALGYSAQDAATLTGAFADMTALYQVAYGNPLPSGYALPYNFTTSSTQIIGPA